MKLIKRNSPRKYCTKRRHKLYIPRGETDIAEYIALFCHYNFLTR